MAQVTYEFHENASWRDLFETVFCVQGTVNVASLDDGVGASESVVVPGVQLGDIVLGRSFGVSTAGITVTANVTAADVAAVTTLTSTGVFSAGETVVLGDRTYTFRATNFTSPPVADEILIGANQTASHLNLLKAINLTGVAGTNYSVGTEKNSKVAGVSADGTHTLFKARYAGTAGNSIVTTETCANASFTSTVMASGTDATVTIRFQNESGGTLDLASTTFNLLIGRPNSNLFRPTRY